jgi:hypothetical protein
MDAFAVAPDPGLLAFVDDRSTREILAELLRMPPSAFVLEVLMTIDRAALGGDDAVTFLEVLQRVQSRLHGVQAEVLVAAASPERMVEEYAILDPRPGHDEQRTVRIEDAIREEIAAALRWSPATAQARVDAARLMCSSLGRTKQALLEGAITQQHAAVIVDAAGRIDRDHARLQDRVLPVAGAATVSATRTAARRAVLAIDAEGERRRRLAARCTRAVYVVDELDGISTLIARMSTESAHAVMSAVNGLAQSADDPTASDPASPTRIGERRAEALARLVLGGDRGAAPVTAHLDLVIDLDTLVGLRDGQATLTGAGAVPADLVRGLLDDPTVGCTVRRIVTDPVTGHLLDVGRTSYRLPAELRRLIRARDQVCRFPGCRRAADRCEVDHAVAWDDGGTTSAANLGALCTRHHQLKTHGGWRISASRVDGSCDWISPMGRAYHGEAAPVLERPPPTPCEA